MGRVRQSGWSQRSSASEQQSGTASAVARFVGLWRHARDADVRGDEFQEKFAADGWV